jgi:hypothetical protein
MPPLPHRTRESLGGDSGGHHAGRSPTGHWSERLGFRDRLDVVAVHRKPNRRFGDARCEGCISTGSGWDATGAMARLEVA